MKKIAKFWNRTGLVPKIIVGLLIGILLGVAAPGLSVISLLGTLFVGALRAVAPLLVFVLVMSSLCHTQAGQRTNMRTIIILYLLGNVLAALSAVLASRLFPITLHLSDSVATSDITPPSGVGEVLTNLLLSVVTNPVESLVNANYLGLLAWACMLGIALRQAGDGTKRMLDDLSNAITLVVKWIIECAPFGILGLVYAAISERGLGELISYGELILVLVGTMAFVALVVNPIVVYCCTRKNPYPLVLMCLRDSFVTAFFTRSSAANIPINLEICKRLGLDEDTYSVSIPLGATINMAGAAVTISTMSLAAANTLGISVDFPTALILCILAAASAAGASGVAGGSLLLIPMACSLFGIPNAIAMQVVGIGFIVGVVQDSCETGLNSSTDVLYTAAAEFRDRRLHPERYKNDKKLTDLEHPREGLPN
ncbi:MAG: serine/threonine transporter SstT [Clostridia bacterium]|nr:serine/threonine transporter SstT [Clostridia bacterium]